MRILVGCEYSGVVRDAFIAKGHQAVSCDLLPTERPGPHHQGSVLDLLGDGWDMAIFHPPCTHLAVSGAKWFRAKAALQKEALAFVSQLLQAPIPRIALENPVGVIASKIKPPTQIVQPWMFGDPFEKTTCLWLKGLPPLRATQIVEPPPRVVLSSGKTLPSWYNLPPSAERGKLRSLTFPGMAAAMAEQWDGAPYASQLSFF